jgi:transposase
MRVLPTYSPELNPCELLFAKAKYFLRYHRDGDRFWVEIMKALATIRVYDVLMAYHHALRIE